MSIYVRNVLGKFFGKPQMNEMRYPGKVDFIIERMGGGEVVASDQQGLFHEEGT